MSDRLAYDNVDIEAARFRKALLEEVGDPVDELTLSIAARDLHVAAAAVAHTQESVIAVVMGPARGSGGTRVLVDLHDKFPAFAAGLGVAAELVVVESRDAAEGRHVAEDEVDIGQVALPLADA
ncbi:hypothetical protein [Specibacter cremeus]|uniref:hypothetical protein n=1 Tax=Specibacter cremeus TaxID=1629051 RepID=UPI000F7A6812|nr:hypothetical protein [Specibacter cremeus]